MTISDFLIVAATILGPVLAVQAQKWVERYRESYSQQMALFTTLMMTRGTKMDHDHVRALNTVDIVFRSNREITDCWHEYQDSLTPITSNAEDKFIDLLFVMSKHLQVKVDKINIKRVFYLPQGHVDVALKQAEIQTQMGQMLIGQQKIQTAMIEYLEGRKALKVSIEGGESPKPR